MPLAATSAVETDSPSLSIAWGNNCCCSHPQCARLRARSWCQRWYYVQWVTTYDVPVADVVERLTVCLGDGPFRYSLSQHKEHWISYHRVLLRLGSGRPGLTNEECKRLNARLGVAPAAQPTAFSDCLALSFRCCGHHLVAETRYWLERMSLPGSTSFGDDRLWSDLEAEMNEAGFIANSLS